MELAGGGKESFFLYFCFFMQPAYPFSGKTHSLHLAQCLFCVSMFPLFTLLCHILPRRNIAKESEYSSQGHFNV